MSTFKGENSTISLLTEAEWGGVPSDYSTGKVFQNNDGTFNAERSALESEARTPNAELAGQRLGNTNVSGSFPVEVDPENYKHLFESVFYGLFVKTGTTDVTLTASAFSATSKYTITVAIDAGDQTTVGLTVGSAYKLSSISATSLQHLEGVVICRSKTSSTATFIVPTQSEDTLSGENSDVTIERVDTLRPAKLRKSFNAEETLNAEDGVTKARFMTSGVVASSVELDLPSDGNIRGTFSFVGSGRIASAEYEDFDSNLTNSANAHTNPTPHTKYDPMVLQDGALISGEDNTRCAWLSGSVTIENGTETYYTGCSYDAQGANSGSFRVNVSYEALFEGEQDYLDYKKENSTDIFLKLKDRSTDKCLVLYLPAFKATTYTLNNSTGLVTASISGSAEISVDAGNSAILASYIG